MIFPLCTFTSRDRTPLWVDKPEQMSQADISSLQEMYFYLIYSFPSFISETYLQPPPPPNFIYACKFLSKQFSYTFIISKLLYFICYKFSIFLNFTLQFYEIEVQLVIITSQSTTSQYQNNCFLQNVL